MRLHVLGGRDLVVGFRLAGLDGEVLERPEEMPAAVERAAADPEVGIIVVSSAVARASEGVLERLRVRQGFPIVVEVAEPGEPPRDPEALMKFVGQAVGLRL